MATPLELRIMLHRMRNWSVKRLPDASGEETLHFCIPCDENGIELKGKKKADAIMPDGSNVSAAALTFKLSPVYRGHLLFAVLLQIPKALYQRLVDKGIVDKEHDKVSHPILGSVRPWKFDTKQ